MRRYSDQSLNRKRKRQITIKLSEGEGNSKEFIQSNYSFLHNVILLILHVWDVHLAKYLQNQSKIRPKKQIPRSSTTPKEEQGFVDRERAKKVKQRDRNVRNTLLKLLDVRTLSSLDI